MQVHSAPPGLGRPQYILRSLKNSGANVEPLEERSLFSGGLSGAWAQGVVHFETEQRPAQVYEMPLTVQVTNPSTSPAAITSDGGSSRVKLLKSDDDRIVTGVFLDAVPLRASAPMVAAVSSQGTKVLNHIDTQTFTGRPPSTWKASVPATTRRRVLLIEDDPTSRVALVTLLTRRGWAVTSASTLKEGLVDLSEHPDNVIVDLMLPDGEGEAIVQEIRDSHLAAKVTVMTGVSDPARLARLHDLHPDFVLNKPINLAALLRSISEKN